MIQGGKVGFNNVPRGRVSDGVLKQIKESILNGTYQPGDKLPPEKELLELFNVSRGSLREALRTLEEFGFIVVKSGVLGGAYVTTKGSTSFASNLFDMLLMQRITFAEVLQVRLLIEPGMARLAAKNRTAEHIQALEELNQNREMAVSDRKIPMTVNIDFHQAMARASKNQMLCLLIDAVALFMGKEFKKISFSLKDHQSIIRFHKKITECIKKKDGKNAERLMRDHTVDVIKRFSVQ
jgi:GntR family transcriptional regulator, transcriptional repressor for pyruvate dehydrogenase complex